MFTGIIEDVGQVATVATGEGGGKRLRIQTTLDTQAMKPGDSIAVSGTCLTVIARDPNAFSVDVGPETLARTTVGRLGAGDRVNLERALAIGDRLGGHWVLGHVDAVGTLVRMVERENARDIEIAFREPELSLIAPRGSIAVDGISLTVTQVTDSSFSVSIIPHTWHATALGDGRPGTAVNIEIDVLMRYVARLMKPNQPGGITAAFLEEHGFFR